MMLSLSISAMNFRFWCKVLQVHYDGLDICVVGIKYQENVIHISEVVDDFLFL